MDATPQIVFLDRDSLAANVRRPAFAHHWREYPATGAADVVARLAGARIAITNKVPLGAAEIAQLPQLRMVAVAATGTDMVDLQACRARGIVVSNIRNYATVSVPEHCLMLMLALRRNLRAYCADVDAGRWQDSARFCLLDHPIGELAGSRLGIIGYGALGRAVARLGQAFGMQVWVHTRTPAHEAGVTFADFDSVLTTADVLSLHLPLNADTRHLIGAAELARMQRSALLINTARGGLVDEAALANALVSGVIAGAGFDVLSQEPPRQDNPLINLRLPNLIVTPHMAWASAQAMQTLADMLIDNIEAFAAGAARNCVA